MILIKMILISFLLVEIYGFGSIPRQVERTIKNTAAAQKSGCFRGENIIGFSNLNNQERSQSIQTLIEAASAEDADNPVIAFVPIDECPKDLLSMHELKQYEYWKNFEEKNFMKSNKFSKIVFTYNQVGDVIAKEHGSVKTRDFKGLYKVISKSQILYLKAFSYQDQYQRPQNPMPFDFGEERDIRMVGKAFNEDEAPVVNLKARSEDYFQSLKEMATEKLDPRKIQSETLERAARGLGYMAYETEFNVEQVVCDFQRAHTVLGPKAHQEALQKAIKDIDKMNQDGLQDKVYIFTPDEKTDGYFSWRFMTRSLIKNLEDRALSYQTVTLDQLKDIQGSGNRIFYVEDATYSGKQLIDMLSVIEKSTDNPIHVFLAGATWRALELLRFRIVGGRATKSVYTARIIPRMDRVLSKQSLLAMIYLSEVAGVKGESFVAPSKPLTVTDYKIPDFMSFNHFTFRFKGEKKVLFYDLAKTDYRGYPQFLHVDDDEP